MVELNIGLPENMDTAILIDAVESVCRAHELTCTLKGTLTKYPGAVHWHFKKGTQKGTLEITWWERQNRLWFKVADGRTGKWIAANMQTLIEEIQESLRYKVPQH